MLLVRSSRWLLRALRTTPDGGIFRQLSSSIYALSSGLNDRGSAIAVIRISGDGTLSGITRLIGNKQSAKRLTSNPRKVILSDLVHPETRELIDKGLIIWFPKPNSYTGEDTVELHVHGSRAVVSLLLQVLGSIPHFHPAREGEFTRRAFLNGKLGLIEAEGLQSLIASQTDSQRKLSIQALDGHVGKLYSQWRSDLLQSVAHLEAVIDFAEDELIDDKILLQVQQNLCRLRTSIGQFLREASRKSELIQEGVNMAIIGLPNVGKSTLLNKLCRRDLSIVSPISGTTRDVVEGLLDIKGWSVRISDTAGLKDTCVEDPIELEGIRRAKQRAVSADLILLVLDGPSLLASANVTSEFSDFTRGFDSLCDGKHAIYVINKSDLLSESDVNRFKSIFPNEDTSIISCKTEQSFDELLELIEHKISSLCGNVESKETFITERHQTHLQRIIDSLECSFKHFDNDLALAAYYLRQCIDEMGNITGTISTENILDVIFKDFCIGK